MKSKAILLLSVFIVVFIGLFVFENYSTLMSYFKNNKEIISIERGQLKGLEKIDGGYKSLEDDPWIEFANINTYINEIELVITYSKGGGPLQIFYTDDSNLQYTESSSFREQSKQGDNKYSFQLHKHVNSLRIDFTNQLNEEFNIGSIILNPEPSFSFEFKKMALRAFLISFLLTFIYSLIKYLDTVIKYRYLIALIIFVLFVALKLHGSSIGMWNNNISQADTNSKIFGIDRAIRSDEWLVQTPYMFSQAEHAKLFEYKSSMVRSDGQNMVLANAPTFTIETLGKPFYWGFLLLGVDYGLSWFYCLKLILLLLFSFEICMYLTMRNKVISILGAVWIAFSPPVQWWYTTGAGVVELIIYSQAMVVSVIYFLELKSQKCRIALLGAITLCSMGFIFTIYPAVQVPLGILTLVFILGVYINNRQKVFVTKYDWLSFSLCVVVLAFAVVLFVYNSMTDISLMLNTVYPGRRVTLGGDLAFSNLQFYLSNWLFPFKDATYLNNSEASSFINFMPAFMFSIIFIFRQKFNNLKLVVLVFVYFIFQISWLFVKYPEIIAKASLFSFVPETRLAGITLGLTAVYLSIWFIAEVIRLKPFNLLKIIMICSLVFVVYYYSVQKSDMSNYLGEFIYPTLLFFIFMNFIILRGMKKTFVVCMAGLIFISGVVVNPISSGTGDIFDRPIASKITEIIQKDEQAKWIALDSLVNGQYLLSLGAKTFNSVHFLPDLNEWKKMDVNGEYMDVYNRYAHVKVSFTNEPTSFQLMSPDSFNIELNIHDLDKTGVQYILSPKQLIDYKNFNEIYFDPSSGLYIYSIVGGP
ncbi:hypothetical protein ABGV42_27455 [Paenibacillus pabuli]|uniref:DUF7657 domain-containing protein n=1 Tax=Paenibacillus pabuli TaxID=1472 RepID=UPI003241DE98